jgi:hypothetical protein
MTTSPAAGDELYDLPVGEFVAARDALARSLKAGDDREGAAAVAALRKPTRSAWALNQVARRQPALLDAYLDAVSALRRATDDALAGDASGIRPAQQDERAAIDAVVEAATRHLEGAGEAASAAVVDRVTDSLRAAGADDDAATTVRAGRLVVDLSPGELRLEGFGFAPSSGSGTRTKRPAPAKPDRAAARQAELDRAADEAEAHAAQLLADSAEAREDADEAQKVATQAGRVADAAERRAESAQRKAEQARARASRPG